MSYLTADELLAGAGVIILVGGGLPVVGVVVGRGGLGHVSTLHELG